jgi:hypothetical protein
MTERFAPHVEALAQLGLTQEEIDERPVLVVGYAEGELLDNIKPARQQRIDTILRYVASSQLFKTVSEIVFPDDINAKKDFPGSKVIEVVGAHANWCVAEAVIGIINQGLFAYVDGSKLMGFRSGATDEELARMAQPELRGPDAAQRLELGKNIALYYKPQRIKPHR